MSWPLFMVAAYLIGSIPCGVLIARSRGIDITAHGSGNVGATNVGRVLGRRLGLTCFVLDVSKGAVPVLAAGAVFDLLGKPATDIPASQNWWWLGVAVAALSGHMASIFLGFRGGKGVATAFGALLAMWPTLGAPVLIAFAGWVVIVLLTRTVSIASMVAATLLPIVTIALMLVSSQPEAIGEVWTRRIPALAASVLIALLVLWRHRSNLRRVFAGTENRIGS